MAVPLKDCYTEKAYILYNATNHPRLPLTDWALLMFPEVRVPDNAPLLTEQLGSKPKFWFQKVASVMYLFKEVRPNTGEDWSEKVACELCRLLDLPHVDYDLAIWKDKNGKDKNGVICPTCVPTDGRLVYGNKLLA
jgi:hypothetical protein